MQQFSSFGWDCEIKKRGAMNKFKEQDILSWLGWIKWSCNSNMCVSLFVCILKIMKKLSNNDHLPWVVTFVIGARWHHVTKGRCHAVVLSSFLRLWLVSHLELLKSIVSPMLHFLLSHPFVMPSFCSFFCGTCHFIWTFCSIHCFIPIKD